MTTFRCKTKKQAMVGTRETLHSKHLDMIKNFKNVKKTLNQRRKHLKDLQAELAELEHQEEKNPEDVAKALDLREEIDMAQREIQKIDMNEEEDQYYLNNGDLIFQYFQNIDEIANGPSDADISGEISTLQTHDSGGISPRLSSTTPGIGTSLKVIDFFKSTSDDKSKMASIPENDVPITVQDNEPDDNLKGEVDDDDDTISVADTVSEEKKTRRYGLHDYIERKENFKRAKMLDKYMSNIDPTHVITIERAKEEKCPDCDSEMILNQNEGLSECRTCGYAQEVKVDSDKRSYKEATNTEMSYIAYKRINHFEPPLEWNSCAKAFMLVACAA